MNCGEVLQLLHPYSDGELDLVRHVEIDEHLAGCAACSDQVTHLRSLRDAVTSPSLYHRAPAALRRRVQLANLPVTRRQRRYTWQLTAIAAGVLLLIGASATIGMIWFRAGTTIDDRLADRVVIAHIRSLQVDHLTDVPSSDRHTVKPWFQKKMLDFSPQVPDLSPDYPLSGGRLDYLTDRPVAALVYNRRAHVINLFTWPAVNDKDKAVRGLARQGFNIRYWQRAGMTYWAISDLNDNDFDEFVRLFQEQSPESQSR